MGPKKDGGKKKKKGKKTKEKAPCIYQKYEYIDPDEATAKVKLVVRLGSIDYKNYKELELVLHNVLITNKISYIL